MSGSPTYSRGDLAETVKLKAESFVSIESLLNTYTELLMRTNANKECSKELFEAAENIIDQFESVKRLEDDVDRIVAKDHCNDWNTHLTNIQAVLQGRVLEMFDILVSAVPYLGTVHNHLVHCKLIDENDCRFYQDRMFGTCMI